MNSALALAAFLILVSPLASPAQSPELKVLQIEHDNQLSERVTGAYNAGLAKLDAGYLTGIDRVLASSKAAGDLEGALALEAEKKRVADKGALPANDEQAAKVMKNLRAIYRQELAKLEAQRAANTTTLLTPYIGKLKQLEADLTKADRLADAKAVMDYRQGISAGVPMKDPITSASTPAATRPPIGFSSGTTATGLTILRYPKHPSQNDGSGYTGYVFHTELGKPLGAPHTVKSISKWTKDLNENAVLSGFIKIEKAGSYQFHSASGYDRNELIIDGEIVCAFRDGEQKIVTVDLRAGLLPIVSVGYANSTTEVRVQWKPPGQDKLSDIPNNLLSH
jgi:hypothetical protein